MQGIFFEVVEEGGIQGAVSKLFSELCVRFQGLDELLLNRLASQRAGMSGVLIHN